MSKNLLSFGLLFSFFILSWCTSNFRSWNEDSSDKWVTTEKKLEEEMLFTDEQVKMWAEESTSLPEINGQKINQEISDEMLLDIKSMDKSSKNLPEWYPISKLPLMPSANIIDVQPYAWKGFIVQYQVNENIFTIKNFYEQFLDVDPISETDEEIYYEDVDLWDNVKVMWLTIEDMNWKTSNVFITVFTK
jgi:hypothetical protein